MSGLQIDGLASGLQTGAIIDRLIELERQPVVRLNVKATVLDQKKKAYLEVQGKFNILQARVSDLLKATTLNKKSALVTKADGTASSAVTVQAGAESANGSFSVTVSQLATATRVTSASTIGQGISAATVLQNAGLIVPLSVKNSTATSGTFTINGTSLTVDSATESLNDIVAKINAQVAGVTATITNADGTANPAGNYLKLSSASSMSVGSGADTSNVLGAVNLLAAQPKGATVTGGLVSTGALAASEIHLDGVIIATRATAASNTAAQNAASLAADINGSASATVVATANANGTLTLVSKTRGAGSSINITQAAAATGLSVGATTQATDERISSAGIGGAQVSAVLSGARLATAISGLDVNGNGEFKLNGVSITFNQNESINAIITRINASGAGVLAVYDATQDKLLLTSKSTGSTTIQQQDVTGNFLAAMGVLSASQSLGQNAVFSVSTVNGGASQSSSGNVVRGFIPGVELTLNQVSSAPVTVSIAQDTAGTAQAVKDFVDVYNATMAFLRQKVKVDATGKDPGVLSADSSLRTLEASIRRYLVTPATGLSGKYLSLSDVGLTFGAVGTAVGAAKDLVLDSSKLTTALNESPQEVQALLAGFQSTATLQGGGTGSVASVTGAPSTHHQPGSYLVTTTTSGSISAIFTPTGGVAGPEKFGGTLVAGGTDSAVIPGMVATATNPLTNGTNTITVAVQQKGVLVDLGDFLKTTVATDGLLSSRQDAATKEILGINESIRRAESRLDQRRLRLEAQYAQLESLISQMNTQQQSLQSLLAQMAR
ncbi:MAG: flagellar filament capping protein FliD [Chloroflexi bacterium]|nr:flagellar filament capping protein FliD [Chloroflexota bacterium]